MSKRQPTFFISHGGGPWPWLPEMRQKLATLEASLADIPNQLPEPPRAILMISGHWEGPDFAVMASATPPRPRRRRASITTPMSMAASPHRATGSDKGEDHDRAADQI